MSGIPIESYYKLKNEYLLLKQQNEETILNLNKNVKHLRDVIENLKKENQKLKNENNTNSQKILIKKLQDEKLQLSKKIMDLESDIIIYKNNSNDIDLNLIQQNSISSLREKKTNSYSISNFYFSLIKNKIFNNKIKESLKKKNEEILILKNELMKKESIIEGYKKNKNLSKQITLPFNNIKNNILFKNKSESDILNLSLEKFRKEYFNIITKNSGFKINNNKYKKKESDELNLFEGEEENSNLEKNIFSEINKILEEKRNFIIKTLTSENFSFDIYSQNQNKQNNNSNLKKNNKNNLNKNIMFSDITKDIDKMLEMIKKRKEKVENDKINLEDMKDNYI